MRLGIELRLPTHDGTVAETALAEAGLAEQLGFDLVWIDSASIGQSMAVAAALAPQLRATAVGAVVDADAADPMSWAEIDRVLDGRLVTCLRTAPGADERFAELVDGFVAGLESHSPQIEPTVWIAGDANLAASRGLAYAAADADDGARAWPGIESWLGRRALRLRRPARWPVDAVSGRDLDIHAMAGALAAAQRAWGLDTAILAIGPGDRDGVMRRIAHDVRPRVQLDRLPPGLSDYWDGRMAVRLAATTPATGGDDG
jgi:hypothetical protein